MRLLFTALACLISVSFSAQEQVITYPYNPDVDTDSLIAIPDILDLLVLFGNEFIPEPVTVDGVVITEWLESSSNQCCDSLSAVIDSMQTVIDNIESNSDSPLLGAVSQCGDTIYSSNGYVIIPGSSEANLQSHFPVGSVSDVDGNIYKTVTYGNQEWMVENLKTAIGDYETPWTTTGGDFAGYADSIGYYYSSSDLQNLCPSGWHVPSIIEWQELHTEIFCGNTMNPNGFTNSSNGYDDNNYQILWSEFEEGSNHSAFNLFRTGYWSNSGSYITGEYPENRASFFSVSSCNNGNLYMVNLFANGNGNAFWSLDVGCTSVGNVKSQIRCVKD